MIRKLSNFVQRVRSRFLKVRCNWLASLHGCSLYGLPDVSLTVPLIIDGQGSVRLEPRSSYGCKEAPKFGNGGIRLQARTSNARIQIGSGCAFSNNITICALDAITIGDRCLIGDMVCIFDADHHVLDPEQRWSGQGRIKPVWIGNNVWLGSRSIILRGVTIGDNSVVGAGSVVTRSIPPNCIAAGNPAVVLRSLKQIDSKN